MSNYKKFFVAVGGTLFMVLSTILAVGPELIPMKWLPWVQVILAIAISKGVHRVENVPSLYPADATNRT